jgi:hypothetical protein
MHASFCLSPQVSRSRRSCPGPPDTKPRRRCRVHRRSPRDSGAPCPVGMGPPGSAGSRLLAISNVITATSIASRRRDVQQGDIVRGAEEGPAARGRQGGQSPSHRHTTPCAWQGSIGAVYSCQGPPPRACAKGGSRQQSSSWYIAPPRGAAAASVRVHGGSGRTTAKWTGSPHPPGSAPGES